MAINLPFLAGVAKWYGTRLLIVVARVRFPPPAPHLWNIFPRCWVNVEMLNGLWWPYLQLCLKDKKPFWAGRKTLVHQKARNFLAKYGALAQFGQSYRLITGWSQVRILNAPPDVKVVKWFKTPACKVGISWVRISPLPPIIAMTKSHRF